jgi:hypothetical protein
MGNGFKNIVENAKIKSGSFKQTNISYEFLVFKRDEVSFYRKMKGLFSFFYRVLRKKVVLVGFF